MEEVNVAAAEAPRFELTNPVVPFLFRFKVDRVSVLEVYVVMRSYSDLAMIELLSNKEIELREATDEEDAQDFVTASPSKDREFFNKHVADLQLIKRKAEGGFELVPMTPEQVDIADVRFKLKPAVISRGYNGILSEVIEAMDFDAAIMAVFASESEIKSHCMFALTPGEEVRVDLDHFFRQVSPEEALIWDKAKKVRRLTRGTKILYNHHEILRLYGKMIRRVNGYVLNGKPCDESNKELWLPKIPYLHKLDAVTRYFGVTDRKNA